MGKLAVIVAVLACTVHSSYGAKLHLTIDNTLSGDTFTGTAAKVNVTTTEKYLTVKFSAPYNSTGDNSVHFFLVNDEDRISELRFTPSGMTLYMYWAPYNVLRKIAWDDSVTINATSSDSTWYGSARVGKDYLPPWINRYNAAAVYPKADGDLQYDNLYSITNFGISLPDLMVITRYKKVMTRFFFDSEDGYSDQWSTS